LHDTLPSRWRRSRCVKVCLRPSICHLWILRLSFYICQRMVHIAHLTFVCSLRSTLLVRCHFTPTISQVDSSYQFSILNQIVAATSHLSTSCPRRRRKRGHLTTLDMFVTAWQLGVTLTNIAVTGNIGCLTSSAKMTVLVSGRRSLGQS
jgi:hypothetical protein